MGLSLTPEAVHAVLLAAGLHAAEMDSDHCPETDGFHTCRLPVTHEDRVAVMWHASPWRHDDHRGVEAVALTACAAVLEAAGYQAEIVTEAVSDVYLAVWVEGEF